MKTSRLRSGAQTITGLVIGVLLAGVVVPMATGTDRDVTVASSTSASGGDRGPAPERGGATADVSVDSTPLMDAEAGGPPVSDPAAPAASPTRSAPDVAAPRDEAALPRVRGVDRDAGVIRVGVILYDISGAASLGVAVPNVSPQDQQRMYTAYIDDHNERGGIAGLRIDAVYATVDALAGAESERAACISLTEDHEVYAVMDVGTTRSAAALCLTEEHGQLSLISGIFGLQDSVFARSRDLLFTIQARGGRSVADAADAYHAAGYFDGKTVGLTGDERSDPGGEVVDALEARLRELSIDVAYRSTFSADTDAAASQIPIEVSQHRSHGVDLIVLTHADGARFVQAAEANGYTPDYAATDWNAYFSDSVTQQMPVSFDGTPIYTHSTTSAKNVDSIPEYGVQKRCRETYERHSGRTVNQRGTATEGSAYILLLYVCGAMQMFELGASGASPSLTYEAFSSAMEAVGPTWIAGTGPGSFGPQKHDHADALVRATWTYSCKCWKPDEAF